MAKIQADKEVGLAQANANDNLANNMRYVGDAINRNSCFIPILNFWAVVFNNSKIRACDEFGGSNRRVRGSDNQRGYYITNEWLSNLIQQKTIFLIE